MYIILTFIVLSPRIPDYNHFITQSFCINPTPIIMLFNSKNIKTKVYLICIAKQIVLYVYKTSLLLWLLSLNYAVALTENGSKIFKTA